MDRRQIDVFRVSMRGPADISGLIALIERGELDARNVVAILGKTEGNGGVNDFTREYATAALCAGLSPFLGLPPTAVEERIAFVMSGGTEGVLSPHLTAFARRPASGEPDLPEAKRLSIGVAMTRPFLPEEIGRAAQIEETAAAVLAAMRDAAITDPQDVHYVQVKCPLLTAERVEAALVRGKTTVTKNGYASMGWSRGASSLAVAVALDEIPAPVDDDAVLRDWSLYSGVASASAGIELMRGVVIVFGNSVHATGRHVIGHAMMRDAIDVEGLLQAFSSAGLVWRDGPAGIATDRIVNVFAKAEASPNGLVRGFRHTMLDDTDITSTRHARAAVGGLIAGLAGRGEVYVSGGAEHQGPPGGGPVAVIATVDDVSAVPALHVTSAR
jgi:cyanuric acid amidohydrolase